MCKKLKRITSLLLTLVLAICLVPADIWVSASSSTTIADGIYVLYSSLDSKKVLDVKNNSMQNGSNVQLYSMNATTAQIVRIKHISNGYYAIVMANAPNMALNIQGGTGYCGANVELYSYLGSDNQLWKFIPTGKSGEYYIASKSGGYYLDVSGASSANETNIQVWDANYSTAQKWTLKLNYNVGKAVAYAQENTNDSGAMKNDGNVFNGDEIKWNDKEYNVYVETVGGLIENGVTGTDCTNYVSQCLYAGGMRETSNWERVTKGEKIEDKKERLTWIQVIPLYNYLTGLGYTAETVNSSYSNVHVGDLVFDYDEAETKMTHVTICSKVENGNVKFCGHSKWRKDHSYTAADISQVKRVVVHMSFCTKDYSSITAKSNNTSYFPACGSGYTSIVNALNSIGVDSSYSYRKTIAAANSISGYSGTASQNTQMLNLLKQGKLKKPGSSSSSGESNVSYFPTCGSGYTSIVDALNSIGADSSYSYRKTIAAANGISGYSGTASQNTTMLNLLKQGKLKKP